MIIETTSMTMAVTVTVLISADIMMKMMMTLKDRAVNGPRERAPVRSQLLFSCRNDLTELRANVPTY